MVETQSQLEASKADRNHMLGVLGFSDDAAEIIEKSNIFDLPHVMNARRGTYHPNSSSHRGTFITKYVEELNVFIGS